jgi:hypothetical protein
MSYFDDASLVLIPSGIKNQKIYSVKPLDGSGDLTFSRASSATRVASNGLIEKVRTNLVLQSNTFSSSPTWDNIGSSETGGQTGYDGTTNAWSLIEDSSTGNHLVRGFPTVSGLSTISVYAKAGTRSFLYLRGVQSSANVIGWFNLTTGALGTIQTNGTGKIESVGNGWYRCSLTIANFQSGFEIYVGLSSTDGVTSYAGNGTGNILIQNAQVETGDIATQYIATTTAAVSVGPVSGLPRLDYLNSTCPRLLLEPQRTNLFLYSEQLANWGGASAGTLLSNAAISPDGYQNADIIEATDNDPYRYQNITYTGTVTFSIYVKGIGTSIGKQGDIRFGSTVQAFTLTGSWQRVSVTGSVSGSTSYGIETINPAVVGEQVAVWGAQLEAGAYATSYIPTLGTSVTRVAESFSKSSISSLIGQTEGTFLVDFVYSNTDISVAQIFSISDSTTSNRVYIGTAFGQALIALVTSGGVAQANIPTSFPLVLGQRYRAAIAYKANDFAFYLNGVQIGTDNAGTVPAMNYISNSSGAGSSPANYPLNQLLLFKTRLTNAQLAELTTI